MIYLLPPCPLRQNYCTGDLLLCNRVSKLLSLFCSSEWRHFTPFLNCWRYKWKGIKWQNRLDTDTFVFLVGFSWVGDFSLSSDPPKGLEILILFLEKPVMFKLFFNHYKDKLRLASLVSFRHWKNNEHKNQRFYFQSVPTTFCNFKGKTTLL